MVVRKPVKSLKTFSTEALPFAITNHIRKLAHQACAASKWFGLMSGKFGREEGEIPDEKEVIKRQIDALRAHIYSHIIWYDYETIFYTLLRAADEAVAKTRKKWTPSIDITQYRREMDAINPFAEMAIFPFLRNVNFELVPKSQRSKMMEVGLKSFGENLTELTFSGGASFKSVIKSVTNGMEYLRRLEKFTLKHDCTAGILDVLSRRCQKTLKFLDIESSKGVRDDGDRQVSSKLSSLTSLTELKALEEINLFDTNLSDESLATVLLALENLTHLIRGDYLCDALEWVDYWDENPDRIFLIKEFFPSQKYYFHEDWQMEMVGLMCPFITKMLFIFHERCVSDYPVALSTFSNLTELELFGGSFYLHKVPELLQVKGFRLRSLTLTSMKEIDYKAIALISIHTEENLENLTFGHNCEIVDYQPRPGADINGDEEYERRQNFVAMATTAYEIVKPFKNLKSVTILCAANRFFVTFLLGTCTGDSLRKIDIGGQSEVTDESMMKIFLRNPLTNLEEFHCERSQTLTIATANLIINNCDKLKAISDLQNWSELDPAYLGNLMERVHSQNIELDIRGNHKIRKYLEMRNFERKTYINFLTGPSLERMRRAQRL